MGQNLPSHKFQSHFHCGMFWLYRSIEFSSGSSAPSPDCFLFLGLQIMLSCTGCPLGKFWLADQPTWSFICLIINLFRETHFNETVWLSIKQACNHVRGEKLEFRLLSPWVWYWILGIFRMPFLFPPTMLYHILFYYFFWDDQHRIHGLAHFALIHGLI